MGGRKKISGHVAYLVLYMCCFCERVFVSSGVTVLEQPFLCILIFTSRFQFHLFITAEDFSGGFWYSAWCSTPSSLYLNSRGQKKGPLNIWSFVSSFVSFTGTAELNRTTMLRCASLTGWESIRWLNTTQPSGFLSLSVSLSRLFYLCIYFTYHTHTLRVSCGPAPGDVLVYCFDSVSWGQMMYISTVGAKTFMDIRVRHSVFSQNTLPAVCSNNFGLCTYSLQGVVSKQWREREWDVKSLTKLAVCLKCGVGRLYFSTSWPNWVIFLLPPVITLLYVHWFTFTKKGRTGDSHWNVVYNFFIYQLNTFKMMNGGLV